MALRLALGAGRTRLVRQLLAESVLVAVAGGVGGLAATYLFVELLTRTVSSSPLVRLAVQLTPSPRVAALTFLSSVLAGAGLGLLPALAVMSAADPAQLLAGPALLLAVTAIACYVPARRSATVDPLVTLREE